VDPVDRVGADGADKKIVRNAGGVLHDLHRAGDIVEGPPKIVGGPVGQAQLPDDVLVHGSDVKMVVPAQRDAADAVERAGIGAGHAVAQVRRAPRAARQVDIAVGMAADIELSVAPDASHGPGRPVRRGGGGQSADVGLAAERCKHDPRPGLKGQQAQG